MVGREISHGEKNLGEADMEIKKKRKVMLDFVFSHCEEVARGIKRIKDVDTIAGYDKKEFCNIIDDFIEEVDACFECEELICIDDVRYAMFDIDMEEGGFVNDDWEKAYNYKYCSGWLIPYLKNTESEMDIIAYSKTLCVLIDEKFSINIARVCRVGSDNFDEENLLKLWIYDLANDYMFEDFEELQNSFLSIE